MPIKRGSDEWGIARVVGLIDVGTCLKQLCNEFSLGKEKINFDFQGDDIVVNQKQKIYLYRIAQEALNNAVKHSSASEISVQLIKKENFLVLIIEDDGVGFAIGANDATKGNGIYNMRERVNLLYGRLQIIAEKGKGTLINVRIPI